jgi:transcriptional regulator GlxA family with amidase domain
MKTVDVLLYDGVDELDFCGPYEVLASCRRVVDGKWSEKPAFHVQTVADRRATIQCSHGLCVLPDKSLAQAFEADIIIIPGGPGARRENLPLHILEFLNSASDTAEIIASVCTGAFILAKTGLADSHQITTHTAQVDTLAKMYPKVRVVKGARVVNGGGKLMSSAGISAGIDLALAIIARYEGKETANLAAKRLEWTGNWAEASIHPAAAPQAVKAPAKTGPLVRH